MHIIFIKEEALHHAKVLKILNKNFAFKSGKSTRRGSLKLSLLNYSLLYEYTHCKFENIILNYIFLLVFDPDKFPPDISLAKEHGVKNIFLQTSKKNKK
jgi:hypothetical protein